MVTEHQLGEQLLRPGAQIDRYVVEAKLGEGGAALVYRVRHRRLGTLHALKVLRVLAGSLTDRLIREGRIQATLKHPNIVAVTDVVRIGVFPALVMEHVAGLSLDELLLRYRPVSAEIDALARDILEGMHAAHAQGLIHRNLKPGNILLQVTDGSVSAKVGDFGLARILAGDSGGGERSTRTSVMMGTPAFMAPEQLRSAKNADHRADIFALGAVLYELASGCSAFGGDDLMSTYNASSKGRFRPLDEAAPDAPRRWVDAVHAALRPDPADRPQSVAALAELWFAGHEPPVPTWNPELFRNLAEPSEGESTPSLLGVATATATIIPPPPPRKIRPGRLFFVTALTVASVGTAFVALAAIAWTMRLPPETLVEGVVPPYRELPAPELRPEPPAEPEQAVEAAVAPIHLPAVAAVLPGPEEAPFQPTLARTELTVTGVERAWLEDPAGRRLRPGTVPPGEYTLQVFFDAAKPTRVLAFSLADGERRHVRCDTLTRICK